MSLGFISNRTLLHAGAAFDADACVVVGDEMVYAAYDTIVSMNLQPGGKRVLKTMEEGIGAYGMVENGGQNI